MDNNKIFEENTKLVYYIIKKYFPAFLFDEDFKQVGLLGLWKACITFDDSKGFAFSTYAGRVIINECYMELRRIRKSKKIVTTSIDILSNDYNEFNILNNFVTSAENQYDYSDLLLLMEERLNQKENTVVKLRLQGYNQRDLAEKLGISQPQVSRLIKNIKEKLGVSV